MKVGIRALYRRLMAAYGPQGWWPVRSQGWRGRARAGTPESEPPSRRGFDTGGYHPGDYRTPATPAGRFEVIMGAVLTQNTAWANASVALDRLCENGIRLPSDLLAAAPARVAGMVRSSGYFNQKAKKLRAIAAFFSPRGALSAGRAPARPRLLAEWGIGPETADSILLYAFQVSVFVVDAYTRRILSRIGLIEGKETYDEIQAMFHESLVPRAALYNEYHALIVEHAKAHCRARPECGSCPVRVCRYRRARA